MARDGMPARMLVHLEWRYLSALGVSRTRIAPGLFRLSHPKAPHFEELQGFYATEPERWARALAADRAGKLAVAPVVLFAPGPGPLPPPPADGPWYRIVRPILIGAPVPPGRPGSRVTPTATGKVRHAYDALAAEPYARWHPEWAVERLALAPFRVPGPGAIGYVGWIDGEPVGLVDAFDGGNLVKVENLWVAPERRGQGVGSTLLATAASGRPVAATTEPEADVVEFYRACGLVSRFRQEVWIRRDS